jgi:RimJ/RimL family protein N-acetyltransferase
MTLNYRHATMDDADILMRWRNDPLTVQNNRDNREVTLSEHMSWLRKQLVDDDKAVFICEDETGMPIGMVRFVLHEDKEDGFETGVTVAPEARGKSYGGKILKMVCDDRPEATLYTEVKFDNAASMKSFGAAGFEQIGSYGLWTQWRRMPLK